MNDPKGLSRIFKKDNSLEELPSQDYEGQLAIDVYQTPEAVVVEAPIAGVKPEDLNITVTDDVLTIEGERKREINFKNEEFLVQECYWGSFSRSYILPVPVDSDRARASIKNGILRVILPKQDKAKTKVIRIEGSN
ncbi:Hsp20/alpha crystallin family protein [bacterium]|nr:Hsp20/alpha crystallin family protein [bacterium]